MMKTERRVLFVLLIVVAGLTLLSIFAAAQTAKARTINVDDDGGKDYTTIQDGINASSVGDIVYVYNGIYNEQIMIYNKTINLIGESNQSTIIQGTGASHKMGIFVGASSVNISNLKIDNCYYGIYLDFSFCNNITSNTITNCGYGVYLYSSNYNIITSNTVTNCSYTGIYLFGIGISFNNVTSNNIYNNKQCGLCVFLGMGNTAYNNWWGNATGPHNVKSNPNGTGNNITDGVPFSPWATSPFNITISTPETPPPALNQKPTATISSIAPNPAIYNQSVITFVGSASDPDGTIIEYLWESNISGVIGTTATFTNNSLPAGVHKITFKVKDNNDTWSEPVSTTLTINNTSDGNVSITEKPGEQKKGFIPSLDFSMIVICIIVLAIIAEFRRKNK